MNHKSLNTPKKTIVDGLHSVAKGAISCIPEVGGVAAELFSMVITPPLEKRREAWMNQVANELSLLRETIDRFSWERLKDDDVFVDVFLQASQIALRNHQVEKLVALKNAVCNTAVGSSMEETQQLIFLRYIDELTVVHMKLLDLLDSPAKWESNNKQKFPSLISGGLNHIIYKAFPELASQDTFVRLIIKDLQSRGLLKDFSMGTTMSFTGIMESRSTEMGKSFIRYISESQK